MNFELQIVGAVQFDVGAKVFHVRATKSGFVNPSIYYGREFALIEPIYFRFCQKMREFVGILRSFRITHC